MAHYTNVSDPILCDLIASKSKITDIKLLVDKYSAVLRRVGVLHEFEEILTSNPCDPNDINLFSDK